MTRLRAVLLAPPGTQPKLLRWHHVWLAFALTGLGCCVGALTLLYGAAAYIKLPGLALFRSYFHHPALLGLNLLPPVLLIWLFSVHLDWLPTGGLEGPSSLVLPAVTLALPYLAAYARLLRNSMVQTAQEDFVLYARACGRSRGAILRMVLRNSLQASLTALGMSLPKLVAGSFVVECIFAWPGLGRLCVTAIFNRDLPVIQAYVLLMAVLFVAGNLCMDICAGLLDPRLRERGLR